MQKKLILLLFLFAFIFPFATAKSYSLEKAFINISVSPDAGIFVQEHIIFDFNGQFSYAYRDFPIGQWTIEDLKVYELFGGREYPIYSETSYTGGLMRVKWYFSANYERKEFVIAYTLNNALKIYNDAADFNWKIWGSGWDHSLNESEGSLTLPRAVNNSEVYTWGHPKLEGKIAMLENKTVIFQAFNIPENQWVELRVVFPSNTLNPLPLINYANKYDYNGLPQILEEEKKYREAISLPRLPVRGLLPYFPLVVLLAFLVLYFLNGREPEVKGYSQIYEREVPFDYSPAIASALINQNSRKPEARDFIAVILDLCLKGYFKLNPLKKQNFM